MFKYFTPIENVIHVVASTQYELTRAFIRPQEYYESGIDVIQGNLNADVEYIARIYKMKGLPFDYFSKWNGFNLPGHAYTHWLAQHRPCGLSNIEARLHAAVLAAQTTSVDPGEFYLIGTHRPEEIRHELAHAMFSLDPEYKLQCLCLIDHMKARNFDCYIAIFDFLKARGYAETVIDDEIQAYLCEADLPYWVEKLGNGMGKAVFLEGQAFVANCDIALERNGYKS